MLINRDINSKNIHYLRQTFIRAQGIMINYPYKIYNVNIVVNVHNFDRSKFKLSVILSLDKVK